jgi:hypothetical protein
VNPLKALAIAAICAAIVAFSPLAASAHSGVDVNTPDVLVVGGTPAGVAAAIAAARRGERVTLVSASGDLGGALTGAMMDQWDLNVTSDDTSVERGIFADIYARLGDAFTPEAAARTLASMVAAEPRVIVWYGDTPTSVVTARTKDGTTIERVRFRTASGDSVEVAAPVVVDASDDGDVAALAGAPYDLGRQDTGLDERMQAVTLMFTIDGVDWPALVSSYDEKRFGPGGATDRTAWGYADLMRQYKTLDAAVLVRDLNLGHIASDEVTVNAIDVVGIDGLDPSQLLLARRLSMVEASHLVEFLRTNLHGFENARLGVFAPAMYVRETRHIKGLERLTATDVWSGDVPSDSIGLASYPLDVHPVDATDEPAYAPVRHVYGVPFGVMVPAGVDNLLVASPAISATHLASGSARIIPTTIEEGEAAGAAAALALRDRIDFDDVAQGPRLIVELREDLANHGAIVGSPTPAVKLALRSGSKHTS